MNENNILNSKLIPPSPNINIQTLKPFCRFCITIGALPTSYILSLTYEELLIWLCTFLQDTVIPAINNNGEAVAELQGLYVELKNYVDNYFESSDFQQLVENKLDEMAEDGTLANIFNNILQASYIHKFKTYNDMINYDLKVGEYAETLGYFTPNDGGRSLYLITENETDNLYNTPLTNGKTATKQVGNYTNILSFGIQSGDAIGDKINTIIQNETEIRFNEGNYTISATEKLTVNKSCKLIGNNTTIKIIGGYEVTYYAMCNISNCKNVIIKNITFDGSKANAILKSGSGGHCIVIGNNTENIKILDCKLINSWYDGIVIDDSSTNLNDSVLIENCEFTQNGRNGISVLSCYKLVIINSYFHAIFGDKPPQAGIDIEPYDGNVSKLKDISISNCNFFSCYQSVSNYLDKTPSNEDVNIKISNINIDGNNLENSIGCKNGYLNNNTPWVNVSYENVCIKNVYVGLLSQDYNVASFSAKNFRLVGIKNIGVHFNQEYAWSTNYLGCILENFIFSQTDDMIAGFKFDTVNTNNIPYKKIQIINTNTSNIKNWNLIEESKIINGLVKLLTENYTINYDEYFNKYQTNYATARITFPDLTGNLNQKGLDIKVYLNWGGGGCLGKFYPNSIVGANGFTGIEHQTIILNAISDAWLINNLVGNITPLN